jgi:hypothetical protein
VHGWVVVVVGDVVLVVVVGDVVLVVVVGDVVVVVVVGDVVLVVDDEVVVVDDVVVVVVGGVVPQTPVWTAAPTAATQKGCDQTKGWEKSVCDSPMYNTHALKASQTGMDPGLSDARGSAWIT